MSDLMGDSMKEFPNQNSKDWYEGLKNMVEQHGHQVLMGSPFCDGYLASHPNCKGCESAQGCSRLFKMLEAARFVDTMAQLAGGHQDPVLVGHAMKALRDIHMDILKKGVIKPASNALSGKTFDDKI